MSDALTHGRRIRVFNLTDDYNREALASEVALSFPAERVVRVLEVMEEEMDYQNVLEWIMDQSSSLIDWVIGVRPRTSSSSLYNQWKPTQNNYI